MCVRYVCFCWYEDCERLKLLFILAGHTTKQVICCLKTEIYRHVVGMSTRDVFNVVRNSRLYTQIKNINYNTWYKIAYYHTINAANDYVTNKWCISHKVQAYTILAKTFVEAGRRLSHQRSSDDDDGLGRTGDDGRLGFKAIIVNAVDSVLKVVYHTSRLKPIVSATCTRVVRSVTGLGLKRLSFLYRKLHRLLYVHEIV